LREFPEEWLNVLTILTLHHTARNKDVNGPEECKPLLNGNNDTEGSEIFSEYHENGKDETADHISSTEPVTWKIEDLEAPKSYCLVLIHILCLL